MSTVDVFAAAQMQLGEGPLWDGRDACLVWLDLHVGTIWRSHPDTQTIDSYPLGLPIGAIALRQAGGYVLATQQGFALWEPDHPLWWLANPEVHLPENRFNDGAVDSRGRFWAGTTTDGTDQLSTPHGALYRLDPDGRAAQMDTGFFIPNGIGWSPDERTMYVTDSGQRTIFAYDFDAVAGTISHRRPFMRVPDTDGLPDGVAVDTAGSLWSACWGGGCVIRSTSAGERADKIAVPATYVTSCAFGGAEQKTLYITSAWAPLTEQQRQQEPLAGAIFMVPTSSTSCLCGIDTGNSVLSGNMLPVWYAT